MSTVSVRIRWTPRLLGETWRRRQLGEKTRVIAASLGIEQSTIRRAWKRAGYGSPDPLLELEPLVKRLEAGERLIDLAEERDEPYINLYRKLKYHGILPNLRTVWTEEMIEDVKQQRGLGVPMSDIAETLGVTVSAIHQEMYRRRETEIRQEWTPELIEEARKLKNRGLTYEQVALELGVSSVHSVKLTLKRAGGIKGTNRWSRRKLAHVKRRLERGDTLKQIAKDHGIQRNSLKVMLKRKGLL